MKKKLFFILVFAVSVSYAGPVNWVVAKVNNEPITNYEVNQMMRAMGAQNKEQALDALINQKLQISEIKKRDIVASPYEVDQHIQRLAESNSMSVDELKEKMLAKGISEAKFREETAAGIKQSKLLSSVFMKADERVRPERAREFYDQNKMLFMNFSAINATRYAAETRQEIVDVTNGKFGPRVFSHKISISRSQLNNETAYVFMNMNNGSFTPIMKTPEGYYEVLRVDSKSGMVAKSFEDVKEQIVMMLADQERAKAVESYFEILKAKAVIEYVNR
ncbi:MAG: hypothetical protein GXZ15_03505 [Campylobacter sp.]|nr:hypothetical protein [Campylobacter sp.]